jgi:uncharacterized protein with gpF-like domain
MPRPRRIPATAYPHAAERQYYAALNRAIVAWFQALADDLSRILGLRMDSEGAGIRLDAHTPLEPAAIRLDDFEPSNRAREQAQQAADRMQRRGQAREVDQAMDSARARWLALDAQLQQAVSEVAGTVNRLSERNVQRQVEAALTNRRLAVTLGPPPFGDLQAQADRFARTNAALIRDIGERAAREVEALVQDAVSRGQTETLPALLQRRLNVTRTRAALIAQNQCARLESELSLLRGEAAGAIGFEWLHTASVRPRRDHLAKVGKTYPLSHRPLPREEPNCKCAMRLVFDDLGAQIAQVRAAQQALRASTTRLRQSLR